MNWRYLVIDLFSGAGFASLGFRRAGFRVAAALEIDADRGDVYERNLRVRPMCQDAMSSEPREILSSAGLRPGSRFCLVGYPPCQPFSKLSDTTGGNTRDDPRSKFVQKFAELAAGMRPAAVVFENVPSIASGSGGAFLKKYLLSLDAAGYRTVHGVVDASSAGVPQSRKRVVAVSVRQKHLTKRGAGLLERFHRIGAAKPVTVREAVADLRRLRGG